VLLYFLAYVTEHIFLEEVRHETESLKAANEVAQKAAVELNQQIKVQVSRYKQINSIA